MILYIDNDFTFYVEHGDYDFDYFVGLDLYFRDIGVNASINSVDGSNKVKVTIHQQKVTLDEYIMNTFIGFLDNHCLIDLEYITNYEDGDLKLKLAWIRERSRFGE
jgi:hypothetical protein